MDSLPAAPSARASAVGSGFLGLWREARSPPRPFLALYLGAAAPSWDLTFLRLRRPGDCRQGALRASARSRREDAESSYSGLGEWVGVPVSKQPDRADLAMISQRMKGRGADPLTTGSFQPC